MWVILQKEIRQFFSSLIAYVVLGAFLVAMGLMVWVLDIGGLTILNYGYADLSKFFLVSPFIFMFLVPAITMRSFAEEKRAGTIELLYTRPIGEWNILLGKYLASLILLLFALLPTLLYVYSLYDLSLVEIKNKQTGAIVLKNTMDLASIMGSYLALFLLGAAFTAIGILASSLTKDQIVAFILSVFLCFILYFGFEGISRIDETTDFAYFIKQLGIDFHYTALSKGLIDSRNLAYFITLIGLMLYLTKIKLAQRT
ncbi:MAG: gliding motility-associated ABC transporter permease subunit GldF [Raineya sp.]|nr:gliding motility-associated ABC transporter permease subunit GldF [Raineya sp.]MDW8296600.1 gliding motility-associated ABC transporter permease subunit GldF [Raineya sp.]